MIIIICVVCVLLIAGCAFWLWCDDLDTSGSIFAILFIFCAGIALFCVPILHIENTKKAELINKTYGTEYTSADIFWTGDIINEMILGNKTRIELEQ